LDYDTDKLVPIYGFGAKFLNESSVNHCFPLFTQEFVPNSMEMILQTYNSYMYNYGTIYTFSGPT